jgi:hypothetical protein
MDGEQREREGEQVGAFRLSIERGEVRAESRERWDRRIDAAVEWLMHEWEAERPCLRH